MLIKPFSSSLIAVDINVPHEYNEAADLVLPYLYWLGLSVLPVAIGATMVTYIEPITAGSGIPQVKSYLNGVKIPRIVRIKTLAVKSIGVITSVVGGLAGGKVINSQDLISNNKTNNSLNFNFYYI